MIRRVKNNHGIKKLFWSKRPMARGCPAGHPVSLQNACFIPKLRIIIKKDHYYYNNILLVLRMGNDTQIIFLANNTSQKSRYYTIDFMHMEMTSRKNCDSHCVILILSGDFMKFLQCWIGLDFDQKIVIGVSVRCFSIL